MSKDSNSLTKTEAEAILWAINNNAPVEHLDKQTILDLEAVDRGLGRAAARAYRKLVKTAKL